MVALSVLIVNILISLLYYYSNDDRRIRMRELEVEGLEGLAGLRRIRETVEMCGKVRIKTSAGSVRFLRRLLVGSESVHVGERDDEAADCGRGGVLDEDAQRGRTGLRLHGFAKSYA